jgi:hypothetical protein
MKKKRNTRRKSKEESNSFGEQFVSFGNKRKVFWSVTFATILLSIIGIPIMIENRDFFTRFLIIWIMEIIYIGLYIEGRKK